MAFGPLLCAGLPKLEAFGIFWVYEVRQDASFQSLLRSLRSLSLSTEIPLTGVCPFALPFHLRPLPEVPVICAPLVKFAADFEFLIVVVVGC